MSKMQDQLRARAARGPHMGVEHGQVAFQLNAAADALDALEAAARAAVAYDHAIRSCADSPEKMASFCTAQGDNLDTLYAQWQAYALDGLAKLAGAK